MGTTASDLVTLLRQRGPLLARLLAAPTDASTLTEDVAVSRSTVDRALATFDEWGLIVPDSERLEPTLLARLALTVYDEFETDVTAMVAHEAGETPLWRTTGERTDALKLVADRLDLLAIAQTPRDKRTLVDELSSARTTVDRVVRELEVAGLIQRTATGYTTTSIGQQLTARYRSLLVSLANLLAARDLLAPLSADCGLPPGVFTAADIERTDPATPYRLLTGVRERLETADRIRLMLPTLPNPQLLDVCHQRVVRHGATLELVTAPALTETLTTEYPGPLAEMAAAAAGTFTAGVTATPPFGLVLADAGGSPTVSVLVSAEQRSVRGAIHSEGDAAIAWAEDYYARVHAQATNMTSDWLDVTPPTGRVALSAVADPGRVEREAEGFVCLTAEYFANRAAAPPSTAWRVGFDLVDVHAGYAIDRTSDRNSDEMEQSLTDDLIARLSDGADHALIGPPGSGKSTVCRAVACRWYEQGRGAVFYRESGRGTTFDAPALLSAQLRATDGHALVVVEDAVRAEANTIFRVMRDFQEDETVTFLLDAREGEWDDPTAFPRDARLDAYRTDIVETVPMPVLDERDCERLVRHFQDTTDHEVDISIPSLLRDSTTTGGNEAPPEQFQASQPATLLVVLHRLTLHADPLAGEDARTPTTLTEDIQQTYAALRTDGALALDVGVIVNLLNATGLGVQPALVYALAKDNDDIETVRAALASLEGQIIFPQDDIPGVTSFRTIHEAWSELFLSHLLDSADTDRAASQRFGRCVSALLALTDNEPQRVRSTAAVGGVAPAIDQLTDAPTEWADATIERLFQFGINHPGLAPLFGTSEAAAIDLPTACSSEMVPQCAQWRGEMYFEGGLPDHAQRELNYAVALIEPPAANQSEQLTDVLARSDRYRGALAHLRGESDTAAEFFTHALDRYRTIADRAGEADCHNLLGSVATEQGDLTHAAACYERSLTIRRKLGGPQKKRAAPLNNLGKIAGRRGDFDRAEAYFERSLDIGRDLEETFGVARTLINLGEITRQRGNFDRAGEYCKQGLDLARDIGHPHGIAHGLLVLGKIALDQGNLDQAEDPIRQGLELFRKSKYVQGEAMGRCLFGKLARKRDTLDVAEDHLTAALTLAREGNHCYAEATTLVELGKLALDRANTEQACDRFAEAVEIYRDMESVRTAIETLERLGEICEAVDEEKAALTHYGTAAALVEETEFIDPRESLTERRAQLTDTALDEGEN